MLEWLKNKKTWIGKTAARFIQLIQFYLYSRLNREKENTGNKTLFSPWTKEGLLNGAGGGTRTQTPLRITDFEFYKSFRSNWNVVEQVGT